MPATLPASVAMAASRRTTVVLPLEPVTSAMGTSCTRSHETSAGSGSSRSGHTWTPVPDPTETVSSPARKLTPCAAAAARIASSAGLRSTSSAPLRRAASGSIAGAPDPLMVASAEAQAHSLSSVAV